MDDLIEKVARAMCSADPAVRMGDTERVVQQRVDVEWRSYIDAARAILPVVAEHYAGVAELSRRVVLSHFDEGWNSASDHLAAAIRSAK